jgi:quinolinate synthase
MDAREALSEIARLKLEKDTFVLAHNYQLPEVQEAADFVGDSLALAQKALKIPNRRVLMCGVYFMAETVAILNPEKTVIIPDTTAGCPLANFAPVEMVREWKEKYPEHVFVAYVNSSAAVKAEVDICCTSSNAVKIVKALPQKRIVFLPDRNLGAWVKEKLPEKEIVLWPGFCVVHETVDPAAVYAAKQTNPDALVMVHPECPGDILAMADGVCSTGQMNEFVEKHPEAKRFIVVTEWGMVYALSRRFPGAEFIEPGGKRLECRNMKKNTLDKVIAALSDDTDRNRVSVPAETGQRARKAIEKMLRLS